MTPVREAITLPAIFLTVTLAGGVRIGAPGVIVPPTLFSLVLATLLLGALVQSGTLAADRLMNAARAPAANLNGLVVLLSAFAASAQSLSLVTPAGGLPAVIAGLVLLAMVVQMLVVRLDRLGLLRGLILTLGGGFVLKFIVLASLSSPASGRLARVFQVLFDNVTLGAMIQPPLAAADGYLAFVTLLLYFVGLFLLPSAPWRHERVDAERLPPRARVAGELHD
jgi:hypothetical protein